MSLQDIRTMRLNRQKPSGIVSVVIGAVPKHLRDMFDIELAPGCQPGLMDWRPLVGLWVAVYQVEKHWPTMDAAVLALLDAKAKLFGVATDGEAYPMGLFKSPDDEYKAAYLMRSQLEALCR